MINKKSINFNAKKIINKRKTDNFKPREIKNSFLQTNENYILGTSTYNRMKFDKTYDY